MRMIQFYGYHGTDATSAQLIYDSKVFIPGSTRSDHWLGFGSYFFRDDFDQAQIWSKNKVRLPEFKGEKPAVIEVNIIADSPKVLNLDSRAGLEYLVDFDRKITKDNRLQLIPKSSSAKKSAKVVNAILSLIDPLEKWIILKSFPITSHFDESPELQRMGFEYRANKISYGLQSSQVCVKNNEAIKSESITILEQGYTEKGVSSKKSVTKEMISDEYFD